MIASDTTGDMNVYMQLRITSQPSTINKTFPVNFFS